MSEEQNEMLLLLKELVNKVRNLEEAVYHKDNLLMKAGFVVSETPTPHITHDTAVTDDAVANMEWTDIHKMVERMQ